MTLLVASSDSSAIWIIADAAITGGSLGLRDREHQLKIQPSVDGKALVGFAGDQHHGTRIMETVAALPASAYALGTLLEEHQKFPSTEFAYAYIDDASRGHLIRVADGRAEPMSTFHLGSTKAFGRFQQIRHDTQIDAAPEAIKIFITGSRAPVPVPSALSQSIFSMLRLFAEYSEGDVGGWVTAYLLTNEGAYLCGYAYSVSDRFLTLAKPGAALDHGTAPGGGFGLSVTELGHGHGIVIYWLQKPGGIIFFREDQAYRRLRIGGAPSQFIEEASAAVGQKVELLFSDRPADPPNSIVVMLDESGTPSMTVAKNGDSFSFSVLNTATEFRSINSVNLKTKNPLRDATSSDLLDSSLSEDRRALRLKIKKDQDTQGFVELSALEIDELTSILAEARSTLHPTISAEPPQHAGTRELMVLDPAWRTTSPIHPSLPGIVLRIRHVGLGWLTFLLPWHEVKSLGNWLVDNSRD